MEKGGESQGPVCLEVRKVRPASPQQPEKTRLLCGRVPRSRSHVPRVTADLCLQMGTSTQKLPKAPNCPASRGRSRDGRDSPALPGRGSGVGGASWQSRSVQSRKRKNENRRMNFYYNKAALCQSPGPRAARLPAPNEGRPYTSSQASACSAAGASVPKLGRQCEYTFG